MESVMDLEIVEEEKGVGIADDHNFDRSGCGQGMRGKGMNGLKCIQENQAAISIHPGTGKTLCGMLRQVPVTSVQEQ